MAQRALVRTLAILTIKVGILAPLVSHAQPSLDVEISCEAGDTLQAALASIPAGGRIVIRSGTCTGNLVIPRDVRIQGAGSDRVTLKASDPGGPVLTVPRGVTATISGVTIAGGLVGVTTLGRMSLAFSTVSDNASAGIDVRDGGILDGDKIRITGNKGPGLRVVNGEATLRVSLISGNTHGDGGAGVFMARARTLLVGTRIEENEAAKDGGGLLATLKSTVVLDRVRFFRNITREGHGGGMAIDASTVDMTGGSVFENVTDAGNGGGIAVLGEGELRLSNTTLANNIASFQFPSGPGGWGGGLYVDRQSRASLVHATIVQNSARFAAGIASDSTVTIQASLLAGNLGTVTGGECGGKGRVLSKGWNLLNDTGACRFQALAGDLMGASPQLGPPGPYGGAWSTVPLRSSSPAIDRIPLDACRGTLDQRLKPRPANGGCDVGAFERQPDDAP